MIIVLIIIYIIFSYPVLSNEFVNDKFYFQLYPSENKDKPEEFNLFNLNSEFYTIDSTDTENMIIINSIVKNDETPIQNLSSIIEFDNRFLIKTCFKPGKIIEIIDENSQIFSPNNDYFEQLQESLENIKYCYSTALENPIKPKEYLIVTYWTESFNIKGIEIYSHKYIIFNLNTKTFGGVNTLDPKGNNLYAQSCTNLFYKYIYCTIDPSLPLSKKNHFSIAASQLLSDSAKINLVDVLARFSNLIYHKPIGILKQTYTNTGKTAQYFLTEYHDKENMKTRLMTSLYIHHYETSFILRFEDLDIHYGINIEDLYIEPNLFNHLLPNNEELIIIYIMKGAEGKNLLLLNRYDYQHTLQIQTKFDKYSLSNYIRDDICENPKYLQSMFIISLINYDTNEKQIIKDSPSEKYYKYQKDIGIVISCDNNGEVKYETKKIPLPQCLNVLNQINRINNLFVFTPDKDRIILDINNNLNLKSLRNVVIEFFDSINYNRYIIVQVIQNSVKFNIGGSSKIVNPEKIEFIRTNNYKSGKVYQIPYRIIQTTSTGISSTCHLTSDFCYFEFYYEGQEEGDNFVKHCKEYENNICMECENIIGIKLDNNNNQCICDTEKGFNKEPNITLNMCLCKTNYSFYEDINQCLPDFILNGGPYCITGQDERSLLNIYDYIPSGMAKYNENGLPYCKIPKKEECNREIWFKLGEYVFYSAKINKCVYILYNNKIVMYSNRTECKYIYYDFKNCLNLDINNEEEYYSQLDNAYEYIPDDDKGTLIIKEDNTTFYILNPYTFKSLSSVNLSPYCISQIEEENNLPSLLIFIASIKHKDSISTQVEYSFFNSVPEFMNEVLNMSYCHNPDIFDIYNREENPLIKRQLQNDLGNKDRDYTITSYNSSDYTLEVDEIIINVQVNWTDFHMKIIKELYNERGINIFNSSSDFYNDVCNKFTTPENTDMYLQERRDEYYIRDAICETGCVQIGYDKETERAVCKCKIKISTEGYENVTFSPNELDEKFKKKYILPNIRVVKCFFKNIWTMNFGQILTIILFLAFISLYIKRKYFSYMKKRSIYKWEIPIEKLKEFLFRFESDNNNNNNDDDNNNKNNNKGSNIQTEVDEEEGRDYRWFPGDKNDNNNNDGGNNNKYKRIEINHKNSENENRSQIVIDSEKKSNNKLKINDNYNKIIDDNYDEKGIKEINNSGEIDKFMYANNIKESQNNNQYIKKESNELLNQQNNSQKKRIKNKKNNKANPPDKSQNSENLQEEQIPIPTERNNISNDNNQEERKEEDQNILKKKINNFFYEYMYLYKKNTQDQKGLEEFRLKDCAFFKLFLSKYIPHSTLFFILPFFLFTKYDADDYFVKLVVLILFIGLYTTFNLLTEFDLSHLHLYIDQWYEGSKSGFALFVNIFWPFFFLYLPIALIKKALSMSVFCMQEKDRIEYNENRFRQNNPSKYKIFIQTEKTNIKKFRNNIETNVTIIFWLGIILLFFNFYLAISFFGVYENSFNCIGFNVFLSIVYTFGFSVILHLISTFIKYYDWKIFNIVKFWLFDCLNCKKLVDCSYLVVCKFCYCLFCNCNREEFKEIADRDENNNRNENNGRNNGIIINKVNNNSRNNDNDQTANINIINNQNVPYNNEIEFKEYKIF